jgi:signal peptidase II
MTDPQDGTPGDRQPEPLVDAAAPEAPVTSLEPSAAVESAAAPSEPHAFPEPGPASEGVPPTLLTGVTPELHPSQPPGAQPTFRFFGIVAAVALVLDVTSKAWAEITLIHHDPGPRSIELIKDHLGFTLAYNPGGAWGLFQHHSEYVRRPFFLLVSLLAVAFIINLYGRLTPGQRALKWGLPLVLGGALGNLSDRIIRSNVIDFIDYQAKWIEDMNRLVAKVVKGWSVTNHWPTFNVADIAICVGVGLMAVDMFTSRRGASASIPPRPPATPASVPPASRLPASVPPAPLAGPDAAPDLGGLNVPDATPPLKPEA